MTFQATSSLVFQAVQEAFKLSFTALYIAFIFLFTAIDRQALQLAKCYSSIANLYFTLCGESKRASIRKKFSGNEFNPFNDELNVIHSTRSYDPNSEISYQGPNLNERSNRKLSNLKRLLIKIFSAILMCSMYIGYLLKIGFGYFSDPITQSSRFALISMDSFYSNSSIFEHYSDVPYSTRFTYPDTDYRDKWIYVQKNSFDPNINPRHLDIMGTTSYEGTHTNSSHNYTLSCAMQDEIQSLSLNSGSHSFGGLNNLYMIPKLHCSFKANNTLVFYSGKSYSTRDKNNGIQKVYSAINRMLFANFNLTLFTLSKNENNRTVLTASVMIIDSSSAGYSFVNTWNNTYKTGTPDYYNFFMNHTETFGYTSSSKFSGFININDSTVTYLHYDKLEDYFRIAARCYFKSTPYVLTFSVRDEIRSALDPSYDYYARNIVSYSPSKKNLMIDTFDYQVVRYRTQTLRYESSAKSSLNPSTNISFDDGSNITIPIQIYPIMTNVKTTPTAMQILRAYAPNDLFPIYNDFCDGPPDVKWDITVQIYIIAILFGLSLIIGVLYLIAINCSYLYTSPNYYDLLRDYHEKGEAPGKSIKSIFSIIKPAVVGVGYNKELDANHIGILNEEMAATRPQDCKSYLGKQD